MLLKLVIVVIAIYLLFKLLRRGLPQGEVKSADNHFHQTSAGEDLVEDAICHTYIPLSSALKLKTGNGTVYFCSQKCLDKYVQENQK